MINISEKLNEFEVLQIVDYMSKRGIEHYDLRPGNGCVWASSGSASVPINQYFIFKDGRLVDIQID